MLSYFLTENSPPSGGIGDAALPHEYELALAAAAAVGSEQAVGAVRDRGLHRSSADARDEMIARETNGFGHRRPSDLVACRSHHPVRAEGTGSGHQVVHGRVGLERTRVGPIDDRVGRRGIRCLDLGADHRLVERVPARLAQPAVDCDTCVRFGMTNGHTAFLWRDGVVRRECNAISEPARRKADCSPSLGRKDGLAGWKRSVVLTNGESCILKVSIKVEQLQPAMDPPFRKGWRLGQGVCRIPFRAVVQAPRRGHGRQDTTGGTRH